MDLPPATPLDGNKSAMDILGYGLSATHLDPNAGPANTLCMQ